MFEMHTTCYTEADVWQLLENVPDPEVPVLSVVDLGVIRHVEVGEQYGGQWVQVTITPTYTGCPAMDMIATHIRMELSMAGFNTVELLQQLSPAWTTDWMSKNGKEKLRNYGIAPPMERLSITQGTNPDEDKGIQCPNCGSYNTKMISHFGSTACKALHQCGDCKEPFDYFKCH
jgi:ring-1,2-phenylacetyl-CoA epoxidase subunit PaaD